ncbi:DgyrCDS1717 [Dimorphilus gyrociliatus]|uniref:Amine oxidase n=1 Tax=Dimorphilus gyrociliatus TaxID=2664684 RepID=A0A7I8VBC6_9ANNE|nr:DgyrCDS1717 [Dimorphilus gyrociliatus]
MRSLFILIVSIIILDFVKSKDIIIVGAGISGISAARILINGGHNVTVLEARNRVGGRIHTVEVNNNKVDLGASWIHKDNDNHPIYKLAEKFNLKTKEIASSYKVFTKNDQNERIEVNSSLLDEKYEEYIQLIKSLASDSSKLSSNISVYDYLKNKNLLKSITENKFNGFFLSRTEIDFSASFKSLSAKLTGKRFTKSSDKNENGEKTPVLIFPNGYLDIVSNLIKGVGKEKVVKVSLEKVVTNVTVKDKVSVKTKDGSSYTGDYVIITIPLGVLKNDTITFNPPISEKKRDAINSVGFGTLNKAYLEFKVPFPDNETHIYYFMQNKFQNRNYFNDFYNLGRWIDKSAFMSLSPSTEDQNSEEIDDTSITESCLTRLSIIFNKSIVELKESWNSTIRTRWQADEFSQGSFSYPQVGTTLEDYEELRRSHQKYVLFAGEHTSNQNYGTVQGGYNSGVKAACEIDKKLCSTSSAPVFKIPLVLISSIKIEE